MILLCNEVKMRVNLVFCSSVRVLAIYLAQYLTIASPDGRSGVSFIFDINSMVIGYHPVSLSCSMQIVGEPTFHKGQSYLYSVGVF